jgi:hypothetical protein
MEPLTMFVRLLSENERLKRELEETKASVTDIHRLTQESLVDRRELGDCV